MYRPIYEDIGKRVFHGLLHGMVGPVCIRLARYAKGAPSVKTIKSSWVFRTHVLFFSLAAAIRCMVQLTYIMTVVLTGYGIAPGQMLWRAPNQRTVCSAVWYLWYLWYLRGVRVTGGFGLQGKARIAVFAPRNEITQKSDFRQFPSSCLVSTLSCGRSAPRAVEPEGQVG